MLQNNKLEKQFKKFLDALRQLHINIHFVDNILRIPNYTKFYERDFEKGEKVAKKWNNSIDTRVQKQSTSIII